ncbi:MAG: NTP transferase domain-containing protein [Anaerolineae bacterium]|nr:NTP transferase domain-containing protein [Anaerolineae bacterium]
MTTNDNIPVVVLCGGQGTRMRGDSEIKKELVSIGGQPMLWHVMKYYATYGYAHFVLALGYGADQIKRYFLEYDAMQRDFTLQLGEPSRPAFYNHHEEWNWRVTFVDTGLHTNKGARIRRVKSFLGDAERFFCAYGDDIGNVDLNALMTCHRSHGKLVTLTAVQPLSQYGLLNLGADGQVLDFREKPQMDYWINGGFMIFERGMFDYLQGGDDLDLEREVFRALTRDGQLMVYRHTGYWHTMNTFKDVQNAEQLWQSGQAPWKIW